jgi:integration host factor subunit beta
MGRTQKMLADTVSRELEIPIRTGRRFLQRILDLVADDLVYTQRVELRGLGTFAVHDRPPRRTRHPKTGEPITIPGGKTVRYRTAAAIRRRLRSRS